jgi:hypothetical protein
VYEEPRSGVTAIVTMLDWEPDDGVAGVDGEHVSSGRYTGQFNLYSAISIRSGFARTIDSVHI